jgi:hypothetical protein
LRDPVKDFEDRVDRVSGLMNERVKRLFREKYTRKMFSEPVPMKERVSEWQLMSEMMDSGGVEAAVSMFRSQGLSPESALKEITKLEREAANGKVSSPTSAPVDDPSGGLGALYP